MHTFLSCSVVNLVQGNFAFGCCLSLLCVRASDHTVGVARAGAHDSHFSKGVQCACTCESVQ